LAFTNQALPNLNGGHIYLQGFTVEIPGQKN
jgi:hypothetical protein